MTLREDEMFPSEIKTYAVVIELGREYYCGLGGDDCILAAMSSNWRWRGIMLRNGSAPP